MDLTPLSDFLIVQIHDDPASALIVPSTVAPIPIPKVGTVLLAGPGHYDHGTFVPNPCAKGDVVLLQIGAGTDVKLGGDTYRMVPSRDLFGVFRPEPAL